METGQRGTYAWIVWNAQFLGDLIRTFPELVVGKYVVITAFDSGPLVLSEEEQQRGWHLYGGFAHSPRIHTLADLPYDQYDEWYIAPTQLSFAQCEVFVNYGGFRLQDAAELAALQARFWQQLDDIAPETYLAEGDNLVVATRDVALVERMRQWQLPRPERD